MGHFDDPVAAYDIVAPAYMQLCRRRELYLRGVEREIISLVPPGARSLLDVGGGDGHRAARIAAAAGISRTVVVEPSAGMCASNATETWPIRAEDLNPDRTAERFDLITCLWNVLGHVPGERKRLRALRATAGLLADNGKFFMDVNHRHNASSYGIARTISRWLHDHIFPSHQNASHKNGDVRVEWNLPAGNVSTSGHVFTHREIVRLADLSGLEIEQRIVIDYDNGTVRAFPWQGNLLYLFRRTSRIDSSSAPHTS